MVEVSPNDTTPPREVAMGALFHPIHFFLPLSFFYIDGGREKEAVEAMGVPICGIAFVIF